MAKPDAPKFVTAIFSFKGKNNDEVCALLLYTNKYYILLARMIAFEIVSSTYLCLQLCFKKGDVIAITQADEESWWEGTLNDKTGWFPSNYVKECKAPGICFDIR